MQQHHGTDTEMVYGNLSKGEHSLHSCTRTYMLCTAGIHVCKLDISKDLKEDNMSSSMSLA